MSRFSSLSSKLFLATILVAFGSISSASGQVSISQTAPDTDLISTATNLTGGIGSRIFDEDDPAENHGRGQLFTLTAGDEVAAITIRSAGAQTFNDDLLTINIFEGGIAQWNTGQGHTSAADGDNFFNGTTVNVLYTETFTLSGEYMAGDYITFTLATPLAIANTGDHGFLMTYEQIDTTNSPTSLFYLENQAPAGQPSPMRTTLTTTAHQGGGSRGFHYAIQSPAPADCILADVSGNGIVDFNDIPFFVDVLLMGPFQCEADCDENGLVDFNDIPFFVDILLGTP